jgi:hypothetical protein
MGSKKRNFHKELMARMGFEAEADKVQELFFAGDREGAIAAVPDQFADEVSLVGPIERIRDRLAAWRDSPATTLMVSGQSVESLRQVRAWRACARSRSWSSTRRSRTRVEARTHRSDGFSPLRVDWRLPIREGSWRERDSERRPRRRRFSRA